MTVSKINSIFASIGRFQIKYRFRILAVFLVLTILCCSGLSRFKMVNGTDGWYGDADKIKIDKKHYEEIFGNNHSLGILLVTDDVFSESSLHLIQELGDRLMQIPYAKNLTSLIEVDIPVGNEEGFEVVKPYEKGIPSDPAELKKKRDFIMRGSEKTNSLINSLVSDDGKECWILLTLEPYEGNADEESLKVGYALNDILNSPEFKSDSFKLYGSGQPFSDAQDEIYEYPDYMLRVALGFLVMLVFLIIFVHTPLGVIIPALATLGAIASVMGGMAYFGVKADATLITLPILLGMALSVGYSIHYINMFKLYFRRTGKRKESVEKTVEECGWSVLFTVITTVASLISFALVDMKPVAWMGKTASLVVIAVYLYVALLIPVFLSFGKDRAPSASNEKGATKIDMAFSRWAGMLQKRSWLIVALSLLVFAICVPFMLKVSVKIDVLSIAGDKMPHSKARYELTKQKLGNQYSYSVMISYDEEGSFKRPEVMASLCEFENFLSTLSLTKVSGGKARVTSVTDILKEINRALNEGQEEFYTIPQDDYVLAQLLELSSIEMSKDFSESMDDEFRTVALSIDMAYYDTEEATENVAEINKKLAELFPQAHSTILGDMIEYAEMSSRMVRGELKSFGFSFIVIALLLIIAFASLGTGLISMIPNVAPVFLVAATMGFFKYPLDFSTMTVMPLILGIAVDDTIHLTTHLKYGLEIYGSYKTAMEASFREIGKSMFMTTFILCTIFAVYMFSPLHYLFVIGFLSVIGLAGALLADYTITPALLYIVKPFGKEKTVKQENKQ
ncbi:MMPL family transporter [Treponema sp.]|uniref:efflux RND transporter permease subunit n=1 Tax=Treponema sp. TaxID=166 RepID=UPI0025E03B23|nr:MMPL family transporter [Treponema sp.]MBR4323729.1 MMPL family transporter [Treponema sp.]